MDRIENFAALSEIEQRNFAEALLKTINSENIFTSDTNFELEKVEASDFDGGCTIFINQTNPIEVTRQGTWIADNEEDLYDNPEATADFESDIWEDVKKVFKTLSTEIDGYTVTLDISDVEEGDIISAEADEVIHEDDGIGSYEYFGFVGNDSDPYVRANGTFTQSCNCVLALLVDPIDDIKIETEED